MTPFLVRRFDGIDGSHYQPDAGPMDLARVKAISLGSFISWKCSQSVKYVDPTFAAVREEVHRLGFDLSLFYHWLSSTTDPVAQAQNYLRAMGDWRPREGAQLDAEEAGVTVDSSLGFLLPVESVTRAPASVYSGLYVAGGTIWRDRRIRESKYGLRPMHLAAYVTVNQLLSRLTALGMLDLPIHGWQWASSGYVIDGITGNVDVNAILDRHAYERACRADNPPPPTTGADLMSLPVICNAEQLFDIPPKEGKFVVMDDGTIRHLTPREYRARVNASGRPANDPVNVGDPWTNDEISAAGTYVPPVSSGVGKLTITLAGEATPSS